MSSKAIPIHLERQFLKDVRMYVYSGFFYPNIFGKLPAE
jgi:hypothetical protein